MVLAISLIIILRERMRVSVYQQMEPFASRAARQ